MRTIVQQHRDFPTEIASTLAAIETEHLPLLGPLRDPADNILVTMRGVVSHTVKIANAISVGMNEAALGIASAHEVAEETLKSVPGDFADRSATVSGAKKKITGDVQRKVIEQVTGAMKERSATVAERVITAIKEFDTAFESEVDSVVYADPPTGLDASSISLSAYDWLAKDRPLEEIEELHARYMEREEFEKAAKLEVIAKVVIVEMLKSHPAKLAADRRAQPRVGDVDLRTRAKMLRSKFEIARRDPARWPDHLRAARTFRSDLNPVFAWLLGFDGSVTSTSMRLGTAAGDLNLAPNWVLRANPMLIREYEPRVTPAFMRMQRRSA